MSKTKSVSINQLIKTLQDVKKELSTIHGIKKPGAVQVLLSSDEEGNSFGTINTKDGSIGFEKDTEMGDVLILYPYEENVDL